MMELSTVLAVLFSILVPTKTWHAPTEPLNVRVDGSEAVTLVLTQFDGMKVDADVPTDVRPGQTVDVRALFPGMQARQTYLLYAVPAGRTTEQYVGTPLVIQLRGDSRPGAPSGTVTVKVEPLCVAKLDTTAGPMTLAFYYDEAPNTVANFLGLARGGFYDGLTFHRVVPGFVIQAGDPLGDGSGGPGYTVAAEFNTRPHVEGVASMARESDPLESSGAMLRGDYANTAGSQFFLCLDYAKTRRLDRKYTGFGQLVEGTAVMQTIGGGAVADPGTGRPAEPVVIRKVEVVPVTAGNDPYPLRLAQQSETSTRPAR